MEHERELFAKYLQTELKLSPSTVDAYSGDIRQFDAFLEQKGVTSYKALSQALVTAYFEYLKSGGASIASQKRKQSTLKSFFCYLEKYRHLKLQILPKSHAEAADTPPVLLHPQEIARLLTAPDMHTAKGIRDRAMLELLCATGIKVTELICLDLQDVMIDSAAIRCRHGKDARIISFRPSVKKYVKKYMTQSRAELLGKGKEKAFFLNMSGERLTRQGFNKILRGYASELHLEDRVTPSALRYTFAYKLAQNGLSLDSISDILGHSDASITKTFLKSADRAKLKNDKIYFNAIGETS